jgi:hypothetical protein
MRCDGIAKPKKSYSPPSILSLSIAERFKRIPKLRLGPRKAPRCRRWRRDPRGLDESLKAFLQVCVTAGDEKSKKPTLGLDSLMYLRTGIASQAAVQAYSMTSTFPHQQPCTIKTPSWRTTHVLLELVVVNWRCSNNKFVALWVLRPFHVFGQYRQHKLRRLPGFHPGSDVTTDSPCCRTARERWTKMRFFPTALSLT